MKKAFEEKVQTILVINKMDRYILVCHKFDFRLINEAKMTPEEAYKHITIIIDQMNAALSSFISTDLQQATSDFLIMDTSEKQESEQLLVISTENIE